MIETPVLLSPRVWPTEPPIAPGPLLEQVATLRQENVALRGENAALRERVRELEAQ